MAIHNLPIDINVSNLDELADAIGETGAPSAERSWINVPALGSPPVQLADADSQRLGVMVHNPSANPLRIFLDPDDTESIYLSPRGTLIFSDKEIDWRGEILATSGNTSAFSVLVVTCWQRVV